jgi:hypothetical protein
MKFAAAICTAALWAAATAAATPAITAQMAAQTAALTWLGLVDAGKYPESWHSASSLFRQKIPQAQWESSVAGVRASLGALQSRTLQSATPKESLPGAPDGHYVVLQFAATFEHKASAIETVTPMMDTDGQWHVSGYYIR